MEEFEVEKIIARKVQNDKYFFKILWTDGSTTWEELQNLENCSVKLAEFFDREEAERRRTGKGGRRKLLFSKKDKDSSSDISSEEEEDIDTYQFRPEELQVKTLDDTLVIEGRHEDVRDRDNYTKMYFVRKYQLPSHVEPQSISSHVDSRDHLMVEARKVYPATKGLERSIPIESPSGMQSSSLFSFPQKICEDLCFDRATLNWISNQIPALPVTVKGSSCTSDGRLLELGEGSANDYYRGESRQQNGGGVGINLSPNPKSNGYRTDFEQRQTDVNGMRHEARREEFREEVRRTGSAANVLPPPSPVPVYRTGSRLSTAAANGGEQSESHFHTFRSPLLLTPKSNDYRIEFEQNQEVIRSSLLNTLTQTSSLSPTLPGMLQQNNPLIYNSYNQLYNSYSAMDPAMQQAFRQFCAAMLPAFQQQQSAGNPTGGGDELLAGGDDPEEARQLDDRTIQLASPLLGPANLCVAGRVPCRRSSATYVSPFPRLSCPPLPHPRQLVQPEEVVTLRVGEDQAQFGGHASGSIGGGAEPVKKKAKMSGCAKRKAKKLRAV